jgi:hypothetical protein
MTTTPSSASSDDQALPRALWGLVEDYVGKDLWTIHESGEFRPDGVYLYPPYYPQPRLDSPFQYGIAIRFDSVKRRWWVDNSRGYRFGRSMSLTKHGRLRRWQKTTILTSEEFKRRYPHYEVLQRYYEDHTFLCILR